MDKTVINVSLQKNAYEQAVRPIYITKGDVQAYQLFMRIYDGDIEFPYTSATVARMVFANEKGLINTNNNAEITAQGIKYDMGATEISFPGRVVASLQLLDESGKRLTVSRFLFEVLPDPLDAGPPLPTVPEIEQLNAYIAAVERALEDVYGGVQIDGAYATYEAFITAHPTGNAGDIYLVGATIYVWVVETSEWLNVGQIQGFGIPTDTDTVDFEFVPETSSLKANVRKQMSVKSDANGLKLDGDEAAPSNGKFYGCIGGVKGFFSLPRQMSIASDENGLKLDGDEATPDDGKFYGKINGAKGFHKIIPADGWIPLPAMTRESDNSFSCAADLTGYMKKYYRIRYKQGGGWKYQIVLAVGAYSGGKTIITTYGGTDFLFTSGVGITDGYYSPLETPEGFPAAFNWTPTFTGYSVPPATGIYQFKVAIDGWCELFMRNTANGTSNANTLLFTLPVQAMDITGMIWFGFASVMDNGAYGSSPGAVQVGAGATQGGVSKTFNISVNEFTASGTKKIGALWVKYRAV